ncbi:MAG: carboxypeptidase-like regulatory domain-containing protein [Thermoflexales bacterium]|nr:carboxypeptidase-like regulatory domain-containing protein [Thermoflexales bacterium]
MSKPQLAALVTFCLGFTAIAIGATWLADAPSRAGILRQAHAFANPFAPAQIFTDTYDLQGDNATQPNATFVGNYTAVSCSTPVPIVSNATLWRSGLGNPANDVDWYRVQLGAQFRYTITLLQQQPSDLAFLVLVQDQVGALLASSPSTYAFTTTFDAPTGGNFFIRVQAANAFTITNTENKPYQVTLCSSQLPPTPTPPPPGLVPDPYEPNDDIAEASVPTGTRGTPSFIAVGTSIANLSFTPYATRTADDADWFRVFLLGGSTYIIETSNVQPGVETTLWLYTGTNLLASNNRHTPGQRGSRIVFTAPSTGDYWIKVTNSDTSPRVAGQTYTLSVNEQTPAPTNTPAPTPSPTPYPQSPDRFEYNGDFDFATLIAPGVKYDQLNFVPFQPPNPTTVDNDFFRLPVKQGVFYTCETFDLGPGVDTNIIVYNQDGVGIGGNDDVSPEARARGEFRSRFSWLSGYTGYAYILVGDVNPPRADQAQPRTYALQCSIGLPETPTPTPPPFTPTPLPPPPTPLPPEPTPTPVPTPRPAQNLSVRPAEPPPPSAPTPTPPPRVVAVDVIVFVDLNRNGQFDPAAGEGIRGVSVRASDERNGIPLGYATTDAEGRARLSVESEGPVRVSVPLFGYSIVVNESTTLRLGVTLRVPLPARLN